MKELSPKPSSSRSTGSLMLRVEEKVFPLLEGLSKLKILTAVKDSVFSSLPLIILGFIVFLLWGTGQELAWKDRALHSFSAALGLLGVWVSFFLPLTYGRKESLPTAVISGVLSLFTFLLLFPGIPASLPDLVKVLGEASRGGTLFGFIIGVLFIGVRQIVKNSKESYQIASLALFFLIPLSILLMLKQQGIQVFEGITRLITPLLSGADTLPAALTVVFLMSLFWLAGIHETGVVGGLVLPFYLVLLNANIAARGAGDPLPYIVTPPFFIMCMPGGTGATLPLNILMLFSRSKHLKKIGRLSILPGLVNINEPLLFGTPLILNPIIALPFILTPVILAVVNYSAFYFRLVDRIFILPIFAIPGPIYAYLSTLDIRAAFLVLLNITISFAIYYPFFKALEKSEIRREQEEESMSEGEDKRDDKDKEDSKEE